jgi:hypothetical protein
VAERFAMAATTDPDEAAAAVSVRGEVGLALERALGSDGVLVQPAASGPAPLMATRAEVKHDLRMRTLLLTAPAGLAGAPVVSMPFARSPVRAGFLLAWRSWAGPVTGEVRRGLFRGSIDAARTATNAPARTTAPRSTCKSNTSLPKPADTFTVPTKPLSPNWLRSSSRTTRLDMISANARNTDRKSAVHLM